MTLPLGRGGLAATGSNSLRKHEPILEIQASRPMLPGERASGAGIHLCTQARACTCPEEGVPGSLNCSDAFLLQKGG